MIRIPPPKFSDPEPITRPWKRKRMTICIAAVAGLSERTDGMTIPISTYITYYARYVVEIAVSIALFL